MVSPIFKSQTQGGWLWEFTLINSIIPGLGKLNPSLGRGVDSSLNVFTFLKIRIDNIKYMKSHIGDRANKEIGDRADKA